MEPKLESSEYSRLIARLEFHDNTRNSLLTFSFTAVITILGFALPMALDEISILLCLIPYLLIIPFSARITYYRLSSAHISSFLRVYAPEKMQFELGTREVREGSGIAYKLIAFLVNHEMFLLGLVANIVFYFKCFQCVTIWKWYNYLFIIISVLLLLLVYYITHSAFNYSKMTKKYMKEWTAYQNS